MSTAYFRREVKSNIVYFQMCLKRFWAQWYHTRFDFFIKSFIPNSAIYQRCNISWKLLGLWPQWTLAKEISDLKHVGHKNWSLSASSMPLGCVWWIMKLLQPHPILKNWNSSDLFYSETFQFIFFALSWCSFQSRWKNYARDIIILAIFCPILLLCTNIQLHSGQRFFISSSITSFHLFQVLSFTHFP